jgi:O-antigen/teichoic acid export membrane protein
MGALKITQKIIPVIRVFVGDSLTKKAYLNALAATVDYGARLIVGFLITPMMVSGLGDYFFGMWQTFNRLIGYISPSSGRPTQALKWTLANQQTLIDYDEKRRYFGSAIAVWLLFIPVTAVLGGLLSWFAPYLFNTPSRFLWIARFTIGLLVGNLTITTLVSLPQAVLEGENLGYKRFGLSALLVFMGGGFTWLALYLNTGIVGVAIAVLVSTFLTGLFFLYVARTYIPWFGLKMPSWDETRRFTGLSIWFVGWNLVMNLMMSSDIVILGILTSVEAVANYTLNKYVPEMLINLIAIMVFGASPGLGGILGSGDLEKTSIIRVEIWSLTWLIATTIGTPILLWNSAFLSLWVGEGRYLGSLANLLIIFVIIQIVLIRNDANIIDLTLNVQRKVLLGLISSILAIILAAIFVGYFKSGIVGLSLGFLVGRTMLSLGYPVLVGRLLNIKLSSQLKGACRPAVVMFVIFILSAEIGNHIPIYPWSGIQGWMYFLFSAVVTSGAAFIIAFYVGLKEQQRKRVYKRLQMILLTSSNNHQ